MDTDQSKSIDVVNFEKSTSLEILKQSTEKPIIDPDSALKNECPIVLRQVSDLVVSVFRLFLQSYGQTGISEEHIDLKEEASRESSFWSHHEFHFRTAILKDYELIKVLTVVSGQEETLFGVVLKHENHYFIVFRGSQVAGDWWANFNLKTVQEMGFWLQAGYVDFFRQIKHQLTSLTLNLNAEIYICGHSLGGALASLCAVHLYQHGYHQLKLYLFGAPKVGDDQFRGYITRSFPAIHFQRQTDLAPIAGTRWRYVNVGDVVLIRSQVSRWSLEKAHDIRDYRRAIYEYLDQGHLYYPLYLKTQTELKQFFPKREQEKQIVWSKTLISDPPQVVDFIEGDRLQGFKNINQRQEERKAIEMKIIRILGENDPVQKLAGATGLSSLSDIPFRMSSTNSIRRWSNLT